MPSEVNGELCERIVAESQDAIVFADRDGVIRLWNAGAEAMFGYRAEDAIGRGLDLIIPEAQRQRHWDGWDKVMASGVTRYARNLLAVPATRQDGTRISIEFTIVLVRSDDGTVRGAAATIRDVTARWQRDKARTQRLAELEARLKQLEQAAD